MSYVLKVLSSPEKKMDGMKIPLQEGDNLIGRASPPASIHLDGTKVSKKHCVLVLKAGALKVDDLGSSNGLFVNGKKITSAVLNEKDRLVIGDFVLEVSKEATPPKPKQETKA